MPTTVCEPSHAARRHHRPRGAAPGRAARPRPGRVARAGTRSQAPVRRAATRRLVAVLALLVIASAGVAGPGWGAADVPPPREGVVVVVGEGDTLWDLVGPHVPAGSDRGVYAARVAEANDVDPQRLRPGTPLRLP